jgi:hypothetical protein
MTRGQQNNMPAQQNTALVKIDDNEIEKLDECASVLLDVRGKAAFFSAFKMAEATNTIRQLLTPDKMQHIMALQGTKLGFVTDRDKVRDKGNWIKGPGYPVEVVTDCVIEAIGKGIQPVNNEMNIIAGNCYAAKNFFVRRLNELLGPSNWKLKHGLPKEVRGDKMAYGKVQKNAILGAIVETEVWWKDNGQKPQTDTLVHQIKGDEYSSVDQYHGKATRKCGAWLLENVTGLIINDGDADDAITVDSKVVETNDNDNDNDEMISEEALKHLVELTKHKSIVADEDTAAIAMELEQDGLTKSRGQTLARKLQKLFKQKNVPMPAFGQSREADKPKTKPKPITEEMELRDRITRKGQEKCGDSWEAVLPKMIDQLFPEDNAETLDDLDIDGLNKLLEELKK